MADLRRARREAEKAARDTLSGTLVDTAGQLGVALAGKATAAEKVTVARTKAKTILDAAHAEAAALIAAAEAGAEDADQVYATAWNAGKGAGWKPAKLHSMGYSKPPIRRRTQLTESLIEPQVTANQSGILVDNGEGGTKHAEHVRRDGS